MKSTEAVKNILEEYSENELIFAGKLYSEKFTDIIDEQTYYKILERLTKSGFIQRASKGIYYRPKTGRYGSIPISEDVIVHTYVKDGKGVIVGYSLYNRKGISTQVSKRISVLSSLTENETKNIRNVSIKKANTDFTGDKGKIAERFDILENYDRIQDINYAEFVKYLESIPMFYNSESAKEIIRCIGYKKSTIAFMKNVLDYFKVDNDLNIYLSSLSDYKYPSMEEIYEAARI